MDLRDIINRMRTQQTIQEQPVLTETWPKPVGEDVVAQLLPAPYQTRRYYETYSVAALNNESTTWELLGRRYVRELIVHASAFSNAMSDKIRIIADGEDILGGAPDTTLEDLDFYTGNKYYKFDEGLFTQGNSAITGTVVTGSHTITDNLAATATESQATGTLTNVSATNPDVTMEYYKMPWSKFIRCGCPDQAGGAEIIACLSLDTYVSSKFEVKITEVSTENCALAMGLISDLPIEARYQAQRLYQTGSGATAPP